MQARRLDASWLNSVPARIEAAPQWLNHLQQQAALAYQQSGGIQAKDERWKYCDLSRLQNFTASSTTDKIDIQHAEVDMHRLEGAVNLIFVDGQFSIDLSDDLPAQIKMQTLETFNVEAQQRCLQLITAIEAKKYSLALLALSQLTQANYFVIGDNEIIERPIHCIYISSGGIQHALTLIKLGAHAQLKISAVHVGATQNYYLNNHVLHISQGEYANLTVVNMQQAQKNAVHLAHVFVQQQASSQVQYLSFAAGAAFSREDIQVLLQAPHASCRTGGFYKLTHIDQYIDYHLEIEHAAEMTNSEMLFKGILEQKARAVFNGKLRVQPGAQKILAYQANHNLLLNKLAEVYSKPELEIYADDVKCKHGATTGQLDEETLFYLRSRGIPKEAAIAIMLQSFAGEVLENIPESTLRKYIESRIL